MSGVDPRVVPFGEAAFLVEFGDRVEPDVNARVHALAARLDAGSDGLAGLGRTVPAYASLLVPYEPGVLEAVLLESRLADIAASVVAAPTVDAREVIEIPVRYGYDDGPDLAVVSSLTGLSADAVIDSHAAGSYRVYMLGFAPGFAYLGPLPPELHVSRRAEPRLRVPAGSVAIAVGQTAIYPHETAGGWHIIGRTEMTLWDAAAEPPALLRAGDRVRFVPA